MISTQGISQMMKKDPPCLLCINFKACENLSASMGWCLGEQLDDGYGPDYDVEC